MYLDQIKALIVEKGFTQTEIARLIYVDKAALNKKLNNRKDLTVRELLAICDVLHVSPKHLDFE